MANSIDVVIQKVQKLRALSTSSNPNEAAVAAARALELIQKYDIEESQLSDGIRVDEPVEDKLEYYGEKRSVPGWRNILGYAIAKSLGCESYSTRKVEYVRRENGTYKRFVTKSIWIVGRQSDARTAKYLLGLLTGEIERLAKDSWRALEPRPSASLAPRWRNGFKFGCASEMAKRLRLQAGMIKVDAKSADPTGRALVVLQKREDDVQAAARRLGLIGSRTIKCRNWTGVEHGRNAGASVNLGGRAVAGLGVGLGRVS